jgi:hypothetical protein
MNSKRKIVDGVPIPMPSLAEERQKRLKHSSDQDDEDRNLLFSS